MAANSTWAERINVFSGSIATLNDGFMRIHYTDFAKRMQAPWVNPVVLERLRELSHMMKVDFWDPILVSADVKDDGVEIRAQSKGPQYAYGPGTTKVAFMHRVEWRSVAGPQGENPLIRAAKVAVRGVEIGSGLHTAKRVLGNDYERLWIRRQTSGRTYWHS